MAENLNSKIRSVSEKTGMSPVKIKRELENMSKVIRRDFVEDSSSGGLSSIFKSGDEYEMLKGVAAGLQQYGPEYYTLFQDYWKRTQGQDLQKTIEESIDYKSDIKGGLNSAINFFTGNLMDLDDLDSQEENISRIFGYEKDGSGGYTTQFRSDKEFEKQYEEDTGEVANPEVEKLDTTSMPPLMKGTDADSNITAPDSEGTTEAENMQRGVTGSTENPNPRSKVKDQNLVEKQRGVERDAKSKEIDAKAKEAGRAPLNQDLLTQFNLTFKDKAGNWQGPLSDWSSIDKAKEKFGDKIDSVESMNPEGRSVWDRWIYHNTGHDKNTRSGIKEQQMKEAEESRAIEEKRANGFTDEDIERGYKYGKREDLGASGPVGEKGAEGVMGGAYDAGSPPPLEEITFNSDRFEPVVEQYLANGKKPEDIIKEFESRAMRPPMPGDQEVTAQDVQAVKGLLGMPQAESPFKNDIASVAARAANLPQMTMDDPGAGVKIPMRPLDQIGDPVSPSAPVSPSLDVAPSTTLSRPTESDSGVASRPAPPPSFDDPVETGGADSGGFSLSTKKPEVAEPDPVEALTEHTPPDGVVFNDPKQRKLDFDNARNPYSSDYDPSTSTPAPPVEPVHTPPSGIVFNDPKMRKLQTVDNPYSSQYQRAPAPAPAPAPSIDVPVPQSPSFTGAEPETFSFQGEPAATPQLEPLEEVMAQRASVPVEDEATRQARVQAEADFDNAMTVRRQGDAPVAMPRIEVTDNGLAYNEETGTYRDLDGNPLSEDATTGAAKLNDPSEWSSPMDYNLIQKRAQIEARRKEGEARNVAEREEMAKNEAMRQEAFLNDITPSKGRVAQPFDKPFYDRRIQLDPETGRYMDKKGGMYMPNFDGSGGRPSFTEVTAETPEKSIAPVSAEGEDAQRLLQAYRNRGVSQPELDAKADLLKMSRMPKYERDAYFKQKMASMSDYNPSLSEYRRNMRDPNFNPFENPAETRRMMREDDIPAIDRVPTVEQNAEKALAQKGIYRPGSKQSLRLLGFSDDDIAAIQEGRQAALQAQSYKAKRPRLLNAFSS